MKTNPITFPAHRYATRVTDKLSVVATSIPAQSNTPVQAADAALDNRTPPDNPPPHPTTPVQVASAAVAQTPSTLVGSPQTPTFSSLFPIMRPSFSPTTYDPNVEFAAVPDVPSPPTRQSTPNDPTTAEEDEAARQLQFDLARHEQHGHSRVLANDKGAISPHPAINRTFQNTATPVSTNRERGFLQRFIEAAYRPIPTWPDLVPAPSTQTWDSVGSPFRQRV